MEYHQRPDPFYEPEEPPPRSSFSPVITLIGLGLLSGLIYLIDHRITSIDRAALNYGPPKGGRIVSPEEIHITRELETLLLNNKVPVIYPEGWDKNKNKKLKKKPTKPRTPETINDSDRAWLASMLKGEQRK